MRNVLRSLISFGFAGSILFGFQSAPIQRVVDAELQAPAVRSNEKGVTSTSRALLDRYCVTCHNQQLQTAGLLLDQIDLDQIHLNSEALEKIVRKLRAGQMPPPGRPRPDSHALLAFVENLESSLDRYSRLNPNPGRVASRRMNRLEYVNAIEDLLALKVDGEELLPSDMAGLGFDNNAAVLSMTPALMAR